LVRRGSVPISPDAVNTPIRQEGLTRKTADRQFLIFGGFSTVMLAHGGDLRPISGTAAESAEQ